MAAQAAVIRFLADPASHGGAAVERIDTHISALFLTGDRVFKLKKAVRLPFLDFTRLAARKAACDAELAINRRATPALYLGVRPVTRDGHGRLHLGGDGAVVDWVVEMRRFDQATLFDRLVRSGGLDRGRITQLTEAIFAFHAVAPPRPDRGGARGLAWTIDTNRASMLAHAPAILAVDKVERLAEQSHAVLARHAPLLEARRDAGKVRWCHGDLHLGNICLFEDKPALFDAIEFSEDIACIDVIYDLAFLLMDLDHRGQRRMAAWVMNHYLDLSGDFAGIGPLPLFLSARAAIRAHVLATMAEQSGGDPRRETLAAEARGYLDAALDYLSPPPPRLLAVGGLSGSGKSRMGRLLAPSLAVPGAAVVRSDALRKQMMGTALTQRLGPEGYSAEATERTYQTLLDTSAALLRAGHGVIADGVFARPDQRAAIAQVAAEVGVRFDGLWLETAPEVAAARIGARTGDASDATIEVLERQRSYELGEIRWHRLDTGRPEDDAVVTARQVLGV